MRAGMNTEQKPGKFSPPGTLSGHAGDHRCAARAAVHRGVGQKIALSLKTNAERRGDHRLARHRQVMQMVMEAQGEADDQHRRANFDVIQLSDQMGRRKRGQKRRLRQSRPLNLQGDNVNAAAGIDPLAPKRLAAAIERHRPLRHHPDIDGIQVQLDCQTVRPMMAGLIQHDMPAGR